MAILKLPNEGDTYTGHIKGCEEVAGNFGQQIKFLFANDDILFVPADSAHRQLLHAGFKDAGGNPPKADLDTVVGNTLHFSRPANKTKGAKPYWNIELATGAQPQPSKRLAGPTTVPGAAPALVPDRKPATAAPTQTTGRSRAQVAEAYRWALKVAADAQFEAFKPKGIIPSPESVAAGAAHLGITLHQNGMLFAPLTLEAVAEALDVTPPKHLSESRPFEDEEGEPLF